MSTRTLGLAALAVAVVGGGIVLLLHTTSDDAKAPSTAAAPLTRASSTTRAPAATATQPTLARADDDGAAPVAAPSQAPQLRPEIVEKLQHRALDFGTDPAEPPPRPTTGTPAVRPAAKPAPLDAAQEAARAEALATLAKAPEDVGALRVMVQSACASGDARTATKFNARLPEKSQYEMRRTCADAGIKLPDDKSTWARGEFHPSGIPAGAKPPTK